MDLLLDLDLLDDFLSLLKGDQGRSPEGSSWTSGGGVGGLALTGTSAGGPLGISPG